MSEPQEPHGEPHREPDRERNEEDERRRSNLVVLAIAVVVVIVGVWLVNKLIDLRKQEECLESGRRNCAPISVPQQ